MNGRLLLSAFILIGIVILTAGCTGTSGTAPVATPVPASGAGTGPAASATTSASSLIPAETDSLGARSVTVNIEKDYLGIIHATFQGGPGLIHVKKIDVTVNRADGEVKTSPLGTKIDDTIAIEATKQSDRVMVHVTLDDGKSYKIYDDLVAFKPRQ